MSIQHSDFDIGARLQLNLTRVFSETKPGQRIKAIRDLYIEDATLFEPDNVATGHEAINDAVTALLSNLPRDFKFTAVAPAKGHHGLARLHWQLSSSSGELAISGMDVARFDGHLIQTLHVFIDPTRG